MKLATRHIINRASRITRADSAAVAAESARLTEHENREFDAAYTEAIMMQGRAAEDAFDAAGAAREAARRAGSRDAAEVAYSTALATELGSKINAKTYTALTKMWRRAIGPIE